MSVQKNAEAYSDRTNYSQVRNNISESGHNTHIHMYLCKPTKEMLNKVFHHMTYARVLFPLGQTMDATPIN